MRSGEPAELIDPASACALSDGSDVLRGQPFLIVGALRQRVDRRNKEVVHHHAKDLRLTLRHRRGRRDRVFATGAYFTDTVTQNNLTFQTGTRRTRSSASARASGGLPGTAATLTGLYIFPPATIGPGITNADCLVIENTGDYDLNLTGGIAMYRDSRRWHGSAFLVKAETADSSCNPGRARDLRPAEPAERTTSPGRSPSGRWRPVAGSTSSGRTPGTARATRTPAESGTSPSTRS